MASRILYIQIDDGIKLNVDPGYYLDEPIEGLDLPNIRTSSFDLSGRDGGIISQQFFGMRAISLRGRIYESDNEGLALKRRALQSAVASKSVKLTIQTYDGRTYEMAVKLIDLKMPILRTPNLSNFKLEFVAEDPLIYDVTEGSAFEAVLNRVSGGGYVTPYVLPVEWSPGASPTNIINSGNATVYPVITLTGTGANPKINNNNIDEFIKYNSNLSDGDELVIDMYARTVVLNGGNVRSLLDSGSSFWGLDPGDNLLALTSDNASDTVMATITWKPGYIGV